MKLTSYRCENEGCPGSEAEDIFKDTETPPEVHPDLKCKECGGPMKKWNFKKNCQRFKFMDQ